MRKNSSPLAVVVFCAIVTLASVAIAQQSENKTYPVVATVNGEEITASLVSVLLNRLPQDAREIPIENLYDQIIEDIISTKLFAEAAQADGFTDNPRLVELAARAHDQVLAEAWISNKIQKQITEDDLIKYYEELAGDTESRREVNARHILLETEDEAIALILRIDAGEAFEDLAREHSIGPSAANGGDLGYFQSHNMVPPFAEAAFALDIGAHTSAPVQTQYGWHVIKVEDNRIGEFPIFDEISSEIFNALANDAVRSISDELQANATITRKGFNEIQPLLATP